MKRTEPQLFRTIYAEALEQAGLTLTMARQRAAYCWAEVAGNAINRQTIRRWVDKNGVLHVYLTSPTLKNELGYHRARLVELLNSRCGEPDALTDIRFH